MVTLSREIPDDTAEIDLDELDITSAEFKATYPQIKAYVLEHYGLKVSSLFITQIKRKYSLDVGEHYNLSKPDGRLPVAIGLRKGRNHPGSLKAPCYAITAVSVFCCHCVAT